MKEERFDTFFAKRKSQKSTGDTVVHDLHVIDCILRTSQNHFFFFAFKLLAKQKPERWGGGLANLILLQFFCFWPPHNSQ